MGKAVRRWRELKPRSRKAYGFDSRPGHPPADLRECVAAARSGQIRLAAWLRTFAIAMSSARASGRLVR